MSKYNCRQPLQLTDESFFDAPIPIPPPAEQSAIVRFLNWANDRLDRAVRAKRKTISLLNEQKQAIIHRAVTRGLPAGDSAQAGLDPNAPACAAEQSGAAGRPLKDSGIPWLGKIPEHWEVKRAKYVFKSIDVRSKKGVEELLTVSSSDGIVPRSTKTVLMFKAASYTGHKLCWPGDLVINSLWAWAKGLGVSSHYGIVSTAYGVYRPRTSYSGHALYWHELLRSPAYDWEFQTRSKGIWKSRLQLTDDSFFAMLIVVPPEEASTKIVHHIRESTGGINAAITRLEREIELLREYRTRLTADIVTGKLDVRKAAETLPDTPVEPADPVPSFADTELDETSDPEEAPDVSD